MWLKIDSEEIYNYLERESFCLEAEAGFLFNLIQNIRPSLPSEDLYVVTSLGKLRITNCPKWDEFEKYPSLSIRFRNKDTPESVSLTIFKAIKKKGWRMVCKRTILSSLGCLELNVIYAIHEMLNDELNS